MNDLSMIYAKGKKYIERYKHASFKSLYDNNICSGQNC